MSSSLKTLFAALLMLGAVVLVMQHSIHRPNASPARPFADLERNVAQLTMLQTRVDSRVETLASRLDELQREMAESDEQRKALEEVANPILQKAYQSSQSEGTGGGDTSPPDDDLDDFDDDDL